MIIMRMHGGLGNQMYEYALMYALKKRYPRQKMKIDISDYYRFPAHTGYSLEKYFGIKETLATKSEIRKVYPGMIYNKSYSKTKGLVREMANKVAFFRTKTFKYKKMAKSSIITDFRHNVFNDLVFKLDEDKNFYFTGYWQNVLYFDNYKEELKKVFSPVREVKTEIITDIGMENTVSVHVRRGDYVGSPFDLCGEKYYKKAITYIEENLDKPYYVFFTDDAKFVEDSFKWVTNKIIISNPPEKCDVDMKLMTLCKHHIIANSSFSFWGAYLAEDKGIVVAPDKWKRMDNGYCGINLPKEWVIVYN